MKYLKMFEEHSKQNEGKVSDFFKNTVKGLENWFRTSLLIASNTLDDLVESGRITEEQAKELGLEIDHDDEHCFGDKPFALLVHSPQRAGSLASQALTQRKKDGMWTGYNKVKVAA